MEFKNKETQIKLSDLKNLICEWKGFLGRLIKVKHTTKYTLVIFLYYKINRKNYKFP